MVDQETQDRKIEPQPVVVRPKWHRPEATVLDVENGTLTTVGPHSDGVGSTS